MHDELASIIGQIKLHSMLYGRFNIRLIEIEEEIFEDVCLNRINTCDHYYLLLNEVKSIISAQEYLFLDEAIPVNLGKIMRADFAQEWERVRNHPDLKNDRLDEAIKAKLPWSDICAIIFSINSEQINKIHAVVSLRTCINKMRSGVF